jgi:hypothetical protein
MIAWILSEHVQEKCPHLLVAVTVLSLSVLLVLRVACMACQKQKVP